MLSKTSRKDVAKEKASDLVSAAADAAETGRDKLAPVVENVTGHLSDAADAAAPHVAKAKDAVVESAAPHVEKVKEVAAETAVPKVAEAKEQTRKQARKARKAARKTARKASDNTAPRVEQVKDTAGLTSEQARRLFNDEWMPRVHEAIAAAGAAGTTAYAALPDRARETVETVAPEVVKKRRKKGKLLIALGLLAGAGAVALIVSGKKSEAGAAKDSAPKLPEVERADAAAAEKTTEPVAVSTSDDAVGHLEKKADAAVSGRRGRHAAKE